MWTVCSSGHRQSVGGFVEICFSGTFDRPIGGLQRWMVLICIGKLSSDRTVRIFWWVCIVCGISVQEWWSPRWRDQIAERRFYLCDFFSSPAISVNSFSLTNHRLYVTTRNNVVLTSEFKIVGSNFETCKSNKLPPMINSISCTPPHELAHLL